MASFEKSVVSLGSVKNIVQLLEVVEVTSTDEIVELINNRITSGEFITFFFYLLDGFSDEPQSHEKRYTVVETVLNQVHSQSVSSRQAVSICRRIVSELRKFNNDHLVKLCKFCTKCIQKADSSETNSWKNIFPALLNILAEKKSLEYNEEEITGAAYKSQVISSLIVIDWSANIVTQLAEMFGEMPLTKDEHLEIVNKLLTSLEALTPQEVPPFVFQLLKLCKTKNGKVLFFKLQNYFDNLLYKNIKVCKPSSESMDAIESADDLDSKQAESMVIFHIYNSTGEESITEYLNALKNITKSPEFVLRPFQLTVLLTISTINYYEEKVFEIIKTSISRFYTEKYKAATSHWLREMIPEHDKVLQIIVQIINSDSKEKDLIMQGLVNLGFVLLEYGGLLGREAIVENMWAMGKEIVILLIKEKAQYAYHILKRIHDNISTATQNIQRYIECLHTITRNFGLVLLENHSCTIQLLEITIQVPCCFANDILEAILPLCRISFTIRDHLILFLGKALNLRDMEIRQVVVCGFLKLLKHLKTTNLSALSQSSSSSSSCSLSIMTQMATSTQKNKNAFTNEALCLEVLGILTRCFIQQSPVKIKLYDGLYGAVLKNKELAPLLLKIMEQHFMQFYEPNDEILLPFKFSKILQTKGTEVILTEPLGHFLYSFGLIIRIILEAKIENSNVERFLNIYKRISERLSICELENFELNDGSDLLDITPESQEKVLTLKTAIGTYEALIGFNIVSWNLQEENANIIINLFQGYNRLIQFSKNLSKHKKGDKAKKDDANKSTQTQNTTKSGGGSSKNTFKLPEPILDFHPIQKLLTLLHTSNVEWATVDEANILKRNVEFHKYVLNTSITLFQQLKQSKTIEIEKKESLLKYCETFGGILYNQCLVRYQEFNDFDSNCSVLSLECFYVILQTVDHHFSKSWSDFFNGICDSRADTSKHVENLLDVFKDLFVTTQEESFQDSDLIRFALVILNIITLLSCNITLQSNSNNYMQQLADWSRQLCIEMKITGKIAIALVTLTFNLNKMFKPTLDFLKKTALHLKSVLGTIEEKDDEITCTQLVIFVINDGTATQILTALCNEIKSLIDDIDYVILRLRSECAVLNYRCTGDIERRRDKLLAKERSTCVQISQIISLTTILSSISLGPGQQFESVIKIATNLFSSLTNLAKYFMAKSNKINLAFEAARFDGVVKQAGKKLSHGIYTLIEESQKEQEKTPTPTNKRKKDAGELKSKVLRETRLIPKMIFEMEQFSKTIMQLSNKTKVDLSKYMGQGTTRDFRILNLNNVIEETGGIIEATQTSTIDVTLDNNSNTQSELFSEEEDDPPAKKTKTN